MAIEHLSSGRSSQASSNATLPLSPEGFYNARVYMSKADIEGRLLSGKITAYSVLQSYHYSGLNFLIQPTSIAQTKELK